ncbi:MAG: DUF58 domain-containing protein [Mycobacteriaceae bacterium]
MRALNSGLSTRGRCLIAAGAACAVCALVLDERDLLRIATLLVALPVVSALVCRLALLRLQITRTLRPLPLAVGAPTMVELQVQARSRTPVTGLGLRDQLPDSCGASPRYTVGRLRAHTVTSLRYPLTPRLRGPHRLGPLQVGIADALGLVELTRTVGEATSVLVRPRVDALSGGPPAADGAEHGAPQGTTASTVRDAQLRAYTPGDDTRSIHWPSTARRDELMVRTLERGHGAAAVVLLDIRRCAHDDPGEESSLETAVSLTASIAAHLRRTGTTVRVLTGDGVQLGPADAELDELALLTPSDREDLGGLARLTGRDVFIAVFGELDVQAAATLLDAAGTAARACVVHTLPSSGVGALAAARWTVIDGSDHAALAQLGAALGHHGASLR